MKYLNLLLLLLLFGCETSHVINNAKPPAEGKETVNNIAVAAETATRTWIPWYILLIIILVIICVKTWNTKK